MANAGEGVYVGKMKQKGGWAQPTKGLEFIHHTECFLSAPGHTGSMDTSVNSKSNLLKPAAIRQYKDKYSKLIFDRFCPLAYR